MDVLGQGLVLMLAGMGIVFIFLVVLIITTNISMKGIGRFDHILPQDAPKKAAKPAAAPAAKPAEAPAAKDEPEEEEEMAYIDELVGQEPIPYDERPKQRTEFYVKKTKEELDGDDVAADLLLGYCRPEKLGGIPVRMPRYTQEASFSRINTLLGKVLHNNFIERCAYLAENSGGGNNE